MRLSGMVMKRTDNRCQSRLIRDILHNKEKAGLRTQNIARLALVLFYMPVSAVMAQSVFERIFSAVILIVSLFVTVIFIWSIRKDKNLTAIGVAGAVIDVVLVTAFTINWYMTVGGTAVPSSFLIKNMVTVLSIFMIVVNSQAMKPLYPAITTAGFALVHLVLFWYAGTYPGIEFTDNYYDAFMTDRLSYNVIITKELFIILVGCFMAWMAHNAQKTIIAAATHERATYQLGRFFSPNVAETISKSDDDFTRIGGTIQDVAVMFSDIRDFTSLSEHIPPHQVLEFLSEYHEIMVAIIFKHGGTLDKFIGDAIMATFGTPHSAPDDALRAVRAAIEMEEALAGYNDSRKRRNLVTIKHGIGIHYGPALVGNIGTRERLEYTVLGDTVNVASRIEGSCKKTGETLLFSDAVNANLSGGIRSRRVGTIHVKGKTEALELFTVAG